MMEVFHFMQNFWKKLLLCLPVLALALGVLAPQGAEARQAELNYFTSEKTEVDGQEGWRIEIGVNRDDVKYEVKEKSVLKREVVLDLENTARGKLAQHIKQTGPLVSAVQIDELQGGGDRHTQVRVALLPEAGDVAYRVTPLSADRHARKPFRLALDIYPKPTAPPVGSVEDVSGHTIVLDAGHGGSDTGAVGPSGVTEASVTLAVTQDLRDILQNAGARVVMTRDTDVDVYGPNASAHDELQARVDVGARVPSAEVFLSIHCNAFSNPGAHGMETYYYPGSSAGARFATILNEELEKAGGRTNRGVKSANFYVIHHSPMPASLVELAFITNPTEENLLSDEDYQKNLAMALAKGIARFFRER